MKSTLALSAVMTLCLMQAELLSQQPYPTGYPANQTMPVQFSGGSGSRNAVPAPTPQSISAQPGAIANPSAAMTSTPSLPTVSPAPTPNGQSGVTYSMGATPGYPVSSYPSPDMGQAPISYGAVGCDSPGGCDSCGSFACDGGCGGSSLFSGLSCSSLFNKFGSCGPARPARVWGSAEYLYWWNKNRRVPVLATTGTVASGGVIGQAGTQVLFGNDYDDDGASGIRLTGGIWLNSLQTVGIFARSFSLEEDIDADYGSNGSTILSRPVFDISAGLESAVLVGAPGISRGTLGIDTSNDVTGTDLLIRKMLYYGECNRIDFICGYHKTDVDDVVRVGHNLISTDPSGRVPVGTQITTEDVFRAENDFNGGSIGVMSQGYDGRLTWNLLTKISFGNTQQSVSINGTSTTTNSGGSATTNQGLLALNTNSGVYERDEFTVVPELDLSVSYHVCSSLQFSVGYSAIYWSNVALAGEAIDRTINPTQISGALIGAARPTYSLTDGSFWVQGITFGVHGRY